MSIIYIVISKPSRKKSLPNRDVTLHEIFFQEMSYVYSFH